MGSLTNLEIISIPLHLAGIAFFVYRCSRTTDGAYKNFLLRIGIIYVFLIVVSFNIRQEALHIPMPWWQYVVGNVLMHQAVGLTYFVIDELLNNTTFTLRAILTHRVFLNCLVLTAMMVGVDFVRREHLVSVTDPTVFERSALHAVSHIFWASVPIYISALNCLLYWRAITRSTSLSFVCRCCLSFIGYAIAVFITVLGLSNTLVSLWIDHPHRILIYQLGLNLGRPAVFLFTLLGGVLPATVVDRMVQPFKSLWDARQDRHQALLRYLHDRMTQIVPFVRFQNENVRALRALIEISEARRVIWTHQAHARLTSPREEAAHLYKLLRTRQVITDVGEYIPPVPDYDVNRHNLAVARHLQSLEERALATSAEVSGA